MSVCELYINQAYITDIERINDVEALCPSGWLRVTILALILCLRECSSDNRYSSNAMHSLKIRTPSRSLLRH